MSSIEIRKIGITKLDTDAVVNAANTGLWEGGGVCGYIFHDAGSEEMTAACQKIGHCDEGSAVITPGFKLPAKYVIHAVGPRWAGGNHNEPKLLYSAYKQSLIIAKENGLHSIGFPLISAGIFGYPVDKAWRKAIQACKDFQDANADYEMKIVFAVLDDQIKAEGEKTLQEIVGDKQNEEVVDDIKESAYRWCCKYEMLFQVIAVEDDLREYLKEFSVYEAPKEHLGIFPLLDECMHQAYEAGVVVANYGQIIEENNLSERDLQRPSKEWTDTLTADQVLACIAWHFRRDHFSEGSWICDSVANGYMLTLVRGFIKDFESEGEEYMSYEEIARANHRNGNNCSASLFKAFADKLGISEDEAVKIAPARRSEGGKCGGFLAGRKLLEMIKPEAVEEFEKRFLEQNGDYLCASLIAKRRLQGKNCNDLVGETASILESMM